MPPAEPTLAALPNPAIRYLLATRPPFLSVTFVAALIGLATAYASGVAVNALSATVTVVFALVAHGGINVLNDYYDALNGTDAINTERVFPFTGGSRMIQNGVLTMREMGTFGVVLVGLVIAAGLWLTYVSASGLVWIGATGLVIGWTYSAPPLKFNSRGLGEPCVWAGFALIAVGADFVQRGSLSAVPLVAATGYALLVTNILYINQFPDRTADQTVGKNHWVVRLGVERGRWGYPVIAAAAYLWIFGAVLARVLPWPALVALAPALLSARASRDLLRYADNPPRLAPAIQQTIAAACLSGTLLAISLVAWRWFS